MIHEVTMYGAICDHCKKSWHNDNFGWVAMSDECSIKSALSDDEWHFGDTSQSEGKDGEHYCPECYYFDDEDVFHLKQERKK